MWKKLEAVKCLPMLVQPCKRAESREQLVQEADDARQNCMSEPIAASCRLVSRFWNFGELMEGSLLFWPITGAHSSEAAGTWASVGSAWTIAVAGRAKPLGVPPPISDQSLSANRLDVTTSSLASVPPSCNCLMESHRILSGAWN